MSYKALLTPENVDEVLRRSAEDLARLFPRHAVRVGTIAGFPIYVSEAVPPDEIQVGELQGGAIVTKLVIKTVYGSVYGTPPEALRPEAGGE